MNKSKSIRKRKHVLQGRKTNKTKKKIKQYQVTKNLFIQSGGVKFDFYLPIPEHQIPSLINLVSKHANTAKKILHKDDRARRNDVIDRIESSGIDFFEDVRKGYQHLADKNNEVEILDASQSIELLSKQTKALIERLF